MEALRGIPQTAQPDSGDAGVGPPLQTESTPAASGRRRTANAKSSNIMVTIAPKPSIPPNDSINGLDSPSVAPERYEIVHRKPLRTIQILPNCISYRSFPIGRSVFISRRAAGLKPAIPSSAPVFLTAGAGTDHCVITA
jgi:hypothetical protein